MSIAAGMSTPTVIAYDARLRVAFSLRNRASKQFWKVAGQEFEADVVNVAMWNYHRLRELADSIERG